MEIKFNVHFPVNIGTLYKDNEIDTIGKEAKVDLDLNEVSTITVTFKVGETSFTDTVTIKDIEQGLVQVPFKTDVIKQGNNSFELEALMKNGDVKSSQTYTYFIEKSLENPNSVIAETNYPILIQLLSDVQSVKDAEAIRIKNEQARQVLKDEVSLLKTNLESLQSDLNSLEGNIETNENTRKLNEDDRILLKTSLEELQVALISLENNVASNETNRESNEANRILEQANKVKEINDKIIDVEARCVAKENLIDSKIIDVETRTIAKENLIDNKINEANATILNVNTAKDNTIIATNNAIAKTTEANSKIAEIETRFNTLTATQQQASEVIDARMGYASLKAKMEAIEKTPQIIWETIEG